MSAAHDLAEIKENVKNLSECMRTVVERIETLEGFHHVSHNPTGQNSPANATPRIMNTPETIPEIISNGTIDDPNNVKTVTTKEVRTEPDGTTKQVTRTVTTAVVKSTSYQKAFVGTPVDAQGEPNSGVLRGLSYMDENPAFKSYRTVGIRMPKGQSDNLGVGTQEHNGSLLVTSIAENSPVAKQGILHVGDTILEVNGRPVRTQADLENALKTTQNGVLVKVLPAPTESQPDAQTYLKSFFDYDPQSDSTIPAKEIGLPFKTGDILQIISQDDDTWWQARKVADPTRIGLVPSQALQEKRTSTTANDVSKQSPLKQATLTYEEVGKLCPFGRRVLVLIGAPGVGRRTLKGRLLRHDPQHFATVVPCTSRSRRPGEVEGREYNFLAKDKMKKSIEKGEYLEWGEFNENIYGTTLTSVRDIIKQGKMCVLDCSPQAIRFLYNWEFMPYVVFVCPPPLDELKQLYATVRANAHKPKSEEELVRTCEDSDKLEKHYNHVFDLCLVNRNAEVTFRRLLDALETLKTQPQWIPVSWLFG